MLTNGMNDQSIREGVKVRVIGVGSDYYGRTGKVDALVSYVGGAGSRAGGSPESRGWRVIFDWPLGGLAGRAILREPELEVVTNVLDRPDTSGA
jgi:hypothetical protein